MSADLDRLRSPIIRHRLIVRHPTRAGVIGIDASNTHTLPQVDTGDCHTADVGELNAAIESRYGIRVTVLRSLDHGQVRNGVVERAHEIEVHGGVARGSLDWRRAVSLTLDAVDGAVVVAWQAPASKVSERDWFLPGWFDTACEWIVDALGDAGLAAPTGIRQIRTWASSCVLEVAAGNSLQYFKALPDSGDVECAVTRFLGEKFRESVPRLVAVDVDRRWLLLGACAGRNLGAVDDIDLWTRAAQRYGELQVACMTRIVDLESAGCPRRELESLPEEVEALAADERVIRSGKADGVSHAEAARLRGLVPKLAERCAALRAFHIPDSLEHGDLWPGNIFVDRHKIEIIDWEDVAIAHPFLSIAPLTAGLGHAGLASRTNVDRLEGEYLRAFGSIASPPELRRALELAAPLCFLDMAVRYRAQRPSMVRLHPWMRDLVPQTIRLALARL